VIEFFENENMKTLLSTLIFVCFAMLAFGQQSGLRFDSAVFEPVCTPSLTSQWKSERLPDPVADYRLFQLSHINLPEMYFRHTQAFFCRLELKMEQSTHIPVKFRLGTVQYVDWLEQKRFYSNLEMGF
jgi:hypothetical protein